MLSGRSKIGLQGNSIRSKRRGKGQIVGQYALDGGCGGDSTLMPLAKAVRLLGVASRMMIFIVCLAETRQKSKVATRVTNSHTYLAGVSFMRFSGVNAKLLV